MTNLVILGSSGFLGKCFLNQIISEKFNVKAMIHNTNIDFEGEKFQGDILNQCDLEENISTGDIIINFVGQLESNFSKFIDLNIKGGLNLLNAALEKKPHKIILVSSINVYGDSNTPSKESDQLLSKTSYGIIKILTERLYENFAHVHGLNITILRLSNVYGLTKKTGIIHNIIQSIVEPKKLVVLNNNGTQFRDFLYIDDAINAILTSIKIQQKGFDIFNISSGQRFSIIDLVKIIEEISGKIPNTKMNELMIDETSIWADNSKSKNFLNFLPHVKLNDGLRLMIQNFCK